MFLSLDNIFYGLTACIFLTTDKVFTDMPRQNIDRPLGVENTNTDNLSPRLDIP